MGGGLVQKGKRSSGPGPRPNCEEERVGKGRTTLKSLITTVMSKMKGKDQALGQETTAPEI